MLPGVALGRLSLADTPGLSAANLAQLARLAQCCLDYVMHMAAAAERAASAAQREFKAACRCGAVGGRLWVAEWVDGADLWGGNDAFPVNIYMH